MSKYRRTTDASSQYHDRTTANIARMDSSAAYGNLADAMRDSVIKRDWISSVPLVWKFNKETKSDA
jgi:hypothetical protein